MIAPLVRVIIFGPAQAAKILPQTVLVRLVRGIVTCKFHHRFLHLLDIIVCPGPSIICCRRVRVEDERGLVRGKSRWCPADRDDPVADICDFADIDCRCRIHIIFDVPLIFRVGIGLRQQLEEGRGRAGQRDCCCRVLRRGCPVLNTLNRDRDVDAFMATGDVMSST